MRRLFRQGKRGERGSALILVVLLTLILAAMSIIAMRDVARTTSATSIFRTRMQAQATSDAAVQVVTDYLGNNAWSLVGGAKATLEGNEGGEVGRFGGADDTGIDLDGDSNLTIGERRRTAVVRGAILEYDQTDLTEDCPDGDADGNPDCPALINEEGPTESGLFRNDTSQSTFETRRTAAWRVVARDFVDGFPAIGYGGDYCFKKALVASEARIGVVDQTWKGSNNVGNSRHGMDAMLGPFECGY